MQTSCINEDSAKTLGNATDEVEPKGHTRGAKKAPKLARPWPLLADGQNPHGLEARVAFHLHRTGFVGKRLEASSFLSRPHLQALSQGRLTIGVSEVAELAKRLAMSPRELLRPLDMNEAERWAFYRTSARHRLHVWRRARACWEVAGISGRLAASLMQLRYQNLTQALEDRPRGRVLAHEHALRLSSALNIRGGPAALLMFAGELLPHEHKVDEVVAPLTTEQMDALKGLCLQAHLRTGGERA